MGGYVCDFSCQYTSYGDDWFISVKERAFITKR